MLAALGMWWLATAALAGDLCGDDPVASLESAVAEVHAKYIGVDEAAFDRAAGLLEASITCLDDVPPGATVARLHQAKALVAFVNGQKGAARRAMIAARLADPTWKLDLGLFPEGHPYRTLWAAATDAGGVREIGSIAPKTWVVDGIERDEAPYDRAFLLQVREGREINFADYLYDYEDIPNLGQDTHESAWITPRLVAVGGFLAARVLDAEQTATGPGLSDQAAGALGGGGGLSLRLTPISFFGLETQLASVGGADPLLGGSFALEAHGVAIFGAATPVSEDLQLYGGARIGYARDTVIAWANGADGQTQTLWPLNLVVGGAEAGVRSDTLDLRLVGDALLAGADGLYEIRAGGTGSLLVAGPLAADLSLSARSGALTLSGTADSPIGERTDVELRIQLGPTLWFE